MRTLSTMLCLGLSTLEMTSALKVGVISDLHMKLQYNPNSSAIGCGLPANKIVKKDINQGFLQDTPDPVALLGRLGCDAPQELVDYMLSLFVKNNGDTDFITLNGDLIAHGLADDVPKNGEKSNTDHFALLKQTH